MLKNVDAKIAAINMRSGKSRGVLVTVIFPLITHETIQSPRQKTETKRRRVSFGMSKKSVIKPEKRSGVRPAVAIKITAIVLSKYL